MRSLSRSSCLFVRINVLFQFTLFSFRVYTERLLTVIANMNLTSNELLRFQKQVFHFLEKILGRISQKGTFLMELVEMSVS